MRQLFVAYQPDDKYEVFDTLSSAFDWAYNMYVNTHCSVYLDLIETPTKMNVKWEVFFWDFYLRYKDIVIDYDKMGHLSGQSFLFENGNEPLKTTGCDRTGCVLCGFGCHLEKPGEGRFEMLRQTHPKYYGLLDVCKNNGVTFREAIEWTNEHGNLNIKL